MGKKINKMCDYMRELRKSYQAQKASDYNDIDLKISLGARIDLIDLLLQEASFIKREKNKKKQEPELDLDVGC